jgi:OPA family glycerol-3-phosphate transporter-like MFS transporter
MLSAVINMLMFLAINSKVMFILWCVNGLAQSLTWSPLIKILSDRLTQKKCKEACIFLTTTVATGTLATYLLSAFIIKISNWRSIFILSFLVLGFVSVVWFITIGKIEKEAEIEGYIETDEEMKQARNISTIEAKPIKLWRFIVTAGLLPILVCVIIQGILKDGVTAWVPTFISELFHLGSVTSILITTLLPIVNLAGVYATNYVNNHFLQSEVKTSGYCFAITTFALFCLILFGKYSILIAIPLLALITTGMIGVNTMFISLLPLNFIRTGKVSTITGILNFSVYMGSAVSSFGIGIISQQYGWGITMLIWFMLAFIGAVICFIIRNWR